jgi:hypothetical protein
VPGCRGLATGQLAKRQTGRRRMVRGQTITTGRLQPLGSPPPKAILNRTDLPGYRG